METWEIIKALRICAETGCSGGEHCPYKKKSGNHAYTDCYVRLMHDAAERLEAVSRKPRYEEGEAEIHMRIGTELLSIRDKLMFFDWSGMRPREIAEKLYATKQGVSRHIRVLREQGFDVEHKRWQHED